jgi:hypothetical protein
MEKKLPLSVILILSLASCSRYQYATIESTSINKNDKQEFVVENDTLRLIYNFNGVNAPINISVQNKLNVPISIDWQRSALIVNDTAISYVPGTVDIDGGLHGYSYAVNLHATAHLPEQSAFLPPHTLINKMPMGVTNRIITNVPDSAFHKVRFYAAEGMMVQVKYAKFTETSAPLRFRSYLTVLIGEQPAKPVVYEHSFYISELINSGQPPENIWVANVYRGNQYYVRESTGFGEGSTGFGVIAGTAIIAGATEALGEPKSGSGVRK